ncbi:hypothetical protein O7599_26545 [Streptomyces sp. WMMC500]|uniref:hypothetical protein n=1 Tax=Streptomyces sp. WMMC500 TaxID=3015154 RepID=UPI00248C68DD|nr:hypothetical protein [Streptomyces sp. WMMC500]WBB59132.1 hypothetical protein O7599_26545 [Streptomyces sp. WMMC500]
MGPRSALALTAATAVLLLPSAAAAQEPPGRASAPRCGDPGAGRFPVQTALRGDGAALRAGGARGRVTLRLHNASAGTCRDVHPVAVLGHEASGRLRPDDVRLEFYDAEARRWRAVAFERTGADESAGVFAGGFRGFVLRAGERAEVPVRLGFAGGAPAGRVTVNVTAVQRRGDDGEWVGQSKDYEVSVERERRCCGGTAEPRDPAERTAQPREAPPGTEPPGVRESAGPGRREGPTPGGTPGTPATPAPPRASGMPGTSGTPEAPETPRAAPGAPGTPGARPAPGGAGTPGSPPMPGGAGTPGSPPVPYGPGALQTPPGPYEPGAPDAPPAPGPAGSPRAPEGPGTAGSPAPKGTPAPRWPADVPPAPPLLPDAAPMPESLAATGTGATAAAAGAAGSLLLGTALLLTARHLRRTAPARRASPPPHHTPPRPPHR